MKFFTGEKEQLLEVLETKVHRGINILGLIIFSMVFGVVISIMKNEGLPLRNFFKSLEAAMMKIISVVIWYKNLFHLYRPSLFAILKLQTDVKVRPYGYHIFNSLSNCWNERSVQRIVSSYWLHDNSSHWSLPSRCYRFTIDLFRFLSKKSV